MGLFSSESYKQFANAINKDNPVVVQVLGICSALAVTAKLQPALVMGISVMFVTGFSNYIISLLRNFIPSNIRIIVQLVVISFLVIIVDELLKAFSYEISKQLSVYVGLIITNCILMGRLEAFAMANKPIPSLVDGLANGFGYAVILVIIAFVRELFGAGTIFDIRVIPDSFYAAGYMNNGMLLQPAAALILVGCLVWMQRSRNKELIEE